MNFQHANLAKCKKLIAQEVIDYFLSKAHILYKRPVHTQGVIMRVSHGNINKDYFL